MPVRTAKDSPAGPLQIVSAVSEEAKNKPPDKLVAHPDYGLFWTGSSTLPRLHHPQSKADFRSFDSYVIPLGHRRDGRKCPSGFRPIISLLSGSKHTRAAWSALTGFAGPPRRSGKSTGPDIPLCHTGLTICPCLLTGNSDFVMTQMWERN